MIKLFTAPTTEPVSLTDAKLYLKVDNTADDTLITDLIKSVRIEVESILGWKLISQTWDYWQDRFTDPIKPTLHNIASITHIKYRDQNYVEQTVSPSDYRLFTGTFPEEIEPVYTWPTTGIFPGAVNVRLVVGYAATANIPEFELIKRAFLAILADAYDYREDSQPSHSSVKTIPHGAREILMSARNFR
jgi:uncharacterized phiE125 gp8 family phage protein